MTDRSNDWLNDRIEEKISMWRGTVFGCSLKNMWENGADYEAICEYAGIDMEDCE